ncbi:MFS transporter [Peribacillus cavernae]|uniref:MFS transporter n=1 Tax=Peribacillus cavernae TaxID=1674310 RepID=A0A3S0V823_9BACI|nr:MFS transporter [Peribacillus cavernae]MDQ0219602.1 YNFM family putative membrane transporter [Peribacillus cavernae]RUQ25890.1 MFS transporter [Peribacillus cavernae]
MEYIEPAGKSFRRTIIALFLGSFVTFADLYSTQPVIPVISEQFDVSPATASLTLSVATGTLAVFLLVLSLLSDNMDRKRLMGGALALSAILSICVGFTHELHLLIILRALQGAALAGFPSIAMAYINEEFHPKSLGYVIGIYVSGSSIGGLAGRLMVGTISDYFNWNAAIACLGILSLAISVLFWFILPESKHHNRQSNVSFQRLITSIVHNFKNRKLVLLYLLGFLLMGAFVTIYNYIGIPLMQEPYNLSQTLLSFIFIIYLVGTFSSAWMGGLADRMNRAKVILSGILLMGIGAILTLCDPLVLKIVGLAMFTFGFFGAHSIASSWVGLLAHKSEKAQASSFYLLFYYAGSSLIGAIGGVFLHHYGWYGVIGLISGLLIVAIVFSLLIGAGHAGMKGMLDTPDDKNQ